MIELSSIKVLIVDDQSEARSILRNMLNQLGVTQVFESSDGRDALNFLDAAFDYVDLVLCDWNMPRLNGVELLRQVRSTGDETPFLMITGRSDLESVVEAKGSGVDGYIRKPFSPAQLEVKLRVLLQRKASPESKAV